VQKVLGVELVCFGWKKNTTTWSAPGSDTPAPSV